MKFRFMTKQSLPVQYTQKSALIVEAISDMRMSLKAMLKGIGIDHVDLAKSGEEAVLRCDEHDYDIIICDYQLSKGKTGLQVLEELRASQLVKASAVYIIMTAGSTRAVLMGTLEHKPDDFLVKPFTQSTFERRVNAAFKEKRYFKSVYTALDNDNMTGALASVEALMLDIDQYPTKTKKMFGEFLLKAKDFAKAQAFYQEMMSERRQEWASLGCARAMIGLDDWSAAKRVLYELIDHGCENPQVFDRIVDVELALGKPEIAQTVLERATVISPLGIMRYIRLLEIATMNHDYLAVEKSFRQLIRIGVNSYHGSYEHSLGLARCLLEKEKLQQSGNEQIIKECYSLCHQVKKKHANNEHALMQAKLIEVKAVAQQGQIYQAIEQCKILYEQYSQYQDIDAGLGLDMVNALLSINWDEQGVDVAQSLSKSDTNDSLVKLQLSNIKQVCDEKAALINAVNINHQGKLLYEQGKLEQAIDHFRQAIKEHPTNIELKLNLVLTIQKLIEADADNMTMLTEADELLSALSDLSESNSVFDRYKTISRDIEKLRLSS